MRSSILSSAAVLLLLSPGVARAQPGSAPASGPLAVQAPPAKRAANRPPELSVQRSIDVSIFDATTVTISAEDVDGDPLTLTVTGLPPGASFVPDPPLPNDSRGVSHASGDLQWAPSGHEGSYVLHVVASDGRSVAEQDVRLTVRYVERWETWFMPGLQYVAWLPVDRAELGRYDGVSFEILVFNWVHSDEEHGPSHGRVYLDLDLLRSTDPSAAVATRFLGGFDLSLERNPKRNFLIPYFGLDMGFLHQELVGTVFSTTPLAGVHLWNSRNLLVNVSGGYLLTAQHAEVLRGWAMKAGLNVTLW